MNLLKRYLPVVFATALCWMTVAFLVFCAMRQTGGVFVYPLDDTYIHMAVARNLTEHHVWGISANEFSSASSSPGWTLLLAAVSLLFGTHLLTPLFLNLILAAVVLWAIDSGVRGLKPDIPALTRVGVLCTFVLLAPLPDLVLISMEHVAQTLSIVLLALSAVLILQEPVAKRIERSPVVLLLSGAFLAGAFRYEAVFAIAPVCCLLLFRRRLWLAFATGLASSTIPVIFGAYFHHESGFWLPFSVMMKASLHSSGVHWQTMPRRTLLGTLAITWLVRSRFSRFWSASQTFLLLAFVILFAQVALAPGAYLLRYEAYAVGLAVLALCFALAEAPPLGAWLERFRSLALPGKATTAVLACVLLGQFYSLLHRAFVEGTLHAEQACADRFHEHIQMARFIHENYDHETIIINDIGAVAYYSKATLLDIAGLGSAQPIHVLRSRGRFTSDDVASWAAQRHASIAILQNQWYYVIPLIPPSWTRVGVVHFPRNVVFPDLEFALYAVNASEIPRLCASLASFSMPQGNSLQLNSQACASPTAFEAAKP